MDTTYFIVARAFRWEQKIERSLFIGDTCTVTSTAEAQAVINRIKEEHPKANHHCYAYRVGLGNYPTAYYSDQGEPSGTAGQPILNAILHEELTNTIVVVTRYFGGKKLGIRGLIDAYHSTALQTLKQAGKKPLVPAFTLELELDYPQLPLINHLLQTYEAEMLAQDYGATVKLTARVPEKHRPALRDALAALREVQWNERN